MGRSFLKHRTGWEHGRFFLTANSQQVEILNFFLLTRRKIVPLHLSWDAKWKDHCCCEVTVQPTALSAALACGNSDFLLFTISRWPGMCNSWWNCSGIANLLWMGAKTCRWIACLCRVKTGVPNKVSDIVKLVCVLVTILKIPSHTHVHAILQPTTGVFSFPSRGREHDYDQPIHN